MYIYKVTPTDDLTLRDTILKILYLACSRVCRFAAAALLVLTVGFENGRGS